MDSTTATLYLHKFGANGGTGQLVAWNTANSRHQVVANFDVNSFEVFNARFRNLATASLTAAAAGVKGLIEFDTTLEKHVLTGTNFIQYAAMCKSTAATYVRIPCSMNVTGLGTPATASTATRHGGWLMDATAEQLNVLPLLPVPTGWTGAHDLLFEIRFLLVAAETAADDVDYEGSVRSVTPIADSVDKTATTIAATAYDIGAVTAQYTLHKMNLTVDFDDATNPVAVGDELSLVLNRDTVDGAGKVAGTIVIACNLLVPVFNYDS